MRYIKLKNIVFLVIIIFMLFLTWEYYGKNRSQNIHTNEIKSFERYENLMINMSNKFNSILHTDLKFLKELAGNLYGFNILKSQELPLVRKIPDTRPSKCLNQNYKSEPVSIIIPVFNEFYSVLLRTVHTIVFRTPDELITEIILIDDFSMYYDTMLAFANLKKTFPKVLVYRLNERKGLIKAKIIGESLANSKIIVYMDSHTEVNRVWLEPLISEIINDPMHVVAIPTIDTIDPETFEYMKSPFVKGGFNWGLFFTWIKIRRSQIDSNSIEPILTPTFSGGYFAMTKEMYEHFGGFDPLMKTWGGENLEMSFRIWQCGGTIKIIPCSRLGHIFRPKKPYGDSGSGRDLLENTLRMANVWLDGYIEKFFKIRPEARKVLYGDVRERKKIRENLRCNSFKWYLENVYPEITR